MSYKIFIGIDVSKNKIDVCGFSIKNISERYKNEFDNSDKGFKKFLSWIKSRFKVDKKYWIICFENTGNYSSPLSFFCNAHSLNFLEENPIQIKRSMGFKRGKTDSSDAEVIAKYIYLNRDMIKLHPIPEEKILKLRAILSYRERLVKAGKLINTPSKELINFYSEFVHNYITNDSKSFMIFLKGKIKQAENEINKIIKKDKELNRVFVLATSVPGIGLQTAAYMIVYTRGFTRFSNWKKFSCYSAIAPFEYSSGITSGKKARVGKIGNRKMKTLLHTCALSAILVKGEFKVYYEKKLAEGKHKMAVINIIKNKLVSRVFAAVNRGTPYQRDYK